MAALTPMREDPIHDMPAEPGIEPLPRQIMLVTGMSGAGKSHALRTLEDLGWEAVDNFPLRLLGALLATPHAPGTPADQRPLAIGIDSRTRGFDTDEILAQVGLLGSQPGSAAAMLFLDCAGRELERRYAETRRPHPLAPDRDVAAGIAHERAMLEPLRRAADALIDTTPMAPNDLQLEIRRRFALERSPTRLVLTSFGFARGVPPSADLMFDMRFLRNPHWDPKLRRLTGLDPAVGAFVAADPAYADAVDRIDDLIRTLMPRYIEAGKAYVTVAIGCTGGRHRSVFVTEELSERLHAAGFCPSVEHRNLTSRPADAIEEPPQERRGNG